MKRFLTHTIIFSVTFSLGCFLIILLADGSADDSYLKFTSPKQESLIIGSSRAGQGLQPSILNETLGSTFYNYAFSVRDTPYGEPYFRSIKKKVDPKTTMGRFIVCVNPWTISSITIDPEDNSNFREVGSVIDKTDFVSINPNVEYIVESYQQKNVNFILKKFKKGDNLTFFVHDDGWLEVVIESDILSTKERTQNKINSYIDKLEYEYSGVSLNRLQYLEKTIEFLKRNGKVYLLRIPINSEMLEIENQLVSDFDRKMESISKSFNINYLNEMPSRNEYEYTDGHHLTIDSGKRFSRAIAERISEIEKDN